MSNVLKENKTDTSDERLKIVDNKITDEEITKEGVWCGK